MGALLAGSAVVYGGTIAFSREGSPTFLPSVQAAGHAHQPSVGFQHSSFLHPVIGYPEYICIASYLWHGCECIVDRSGLNAVVILALLHRFVLMQWFFLPLLHRFVVRTRLTLSISGFT